MVDSGFSLLLQRQRQMSEMLQGAVKLKILEVAIGGWFRSQQISGAGLCNEAPTRFHTLQGLRLGQVHSSAQLPHSHSYIFTSPGYWDLMVHTIYTLVFRCLYVLST